MAETGAATEAVVCHGLSRRFGDILAVDGLDLAVRQGEIFGLVGPDGAGKTTTIRLLSTILAPSAGRAEVLGLDVVYDRSRLRGHVGYMSQQFNLYGDLTVEENLRFYADLYGVPSATVAERFDRLIAFSRLRPFLARRAEHLSGGMKQKLALACNLIHEPEILFLDEPTTGVDPVSRRDFWRILSGLHAHGTTLFLTTPYMDEAERCDRVAFMERGRLLTVAAPAAIKDRLAGSVIEVVAEPRREARELLSGLPDIDEVDLYGDRLQVRARNAQAAESAIRSALGAAGFEVSCLRQVAPSMEFAFIDLARERRS